MKKIFLSHPKNWRDLEDKVTQIFQEMGYETSKKTKVQTIRGQVEVDVIATNNKSSVPIRIFIECKYWEKNIPQEKVHAFRTIIHDSGANLGIMIALSNFQIGAKQHIESTNILLMTWDEFQNHYFDEWFEAMKKYTIEVADPICEYYDYYGKITGGLNGTEERVGRAKLLQDRYSIFRKGNRFNPKIFFPMEVRDPRYEEERIITITQARDFFDIMILEHQNALKAFEDFVKELKG